MFFEDKAIEIRETGKFSRQDIIDAETLHFMGGSKPDGNPFHPEFFDLKQQFINAMPVEAKRLAQKKRMRPRNFRAIFIEIAFNRIMLKNITQ